MQFTVQQIVDDIVFLGIFLVIGYIIRELCPPFRKIFLPASLIGGAIILILGPQVLGLIEVPTSLASMQTPFTNLIFTCLCWGFTINRSKIQQYADFVVCNAALMYAQIGVGCGIGLLLMKTWSDLPRGWSLTMPIGFMIGHSVIPAYGGMLEELGAEGVVDIGLVFATVGLLAGVIVGTFMSNIGIRKGWAIYMRDVKTNESKSAVGALPEKLRKPIGHTTVNGLAINNLVFQFAIICVVFWFGRLLIRQIVNPVLGGIVTIPDYIGGILGSFILWPILCRFNLDKYVDHDSVQSLAGFLVDIILIGAMATLNLNVITLFWLPIMIVSAVGIIITIVFTYGLCWLICKDEWFEKASYLFGLGTGVAATGMALLRIVDPENESSVYEVRGVGSAIVSPINNIMLPTVMVPLAYACGGMDALLGAGIAIVLVILSMIIFRGTVKQRVKSKG